MISITELKPKKFSGLSSLFIKFDYHPKLVELMRSINPAYYDKTTFIWEVPVTSLKKILEEGSKYDSIDLNLRTDTKVEFKKFTLSKYKTKPFDYQLEGIQFGLNHPNWLLLDAPGLGKTLTMIYLAQELKKMKKVSHCLIICGVNTLKFNWKKEIQKHSDLSCRILGERVTRTGNMVIDPIADRVEQLKKPIKEFFVITNIETLRDANIIKALKSGKNSFDMVVLDEAHTCKASSAKQAKNLLKIQADYKIALTGTFLLNSPLDSYVPLKWIGVEKSTYSDFKYFYCNYGGYFGNDFLGYKNIDVLKQILDTYALRRTKDILELPPKTIINEYVEMGANQQLFYNNVKEGILEQVDKVHMSAANLLAMVTRLRQATALPSILTTENIESSKVVRACDLSEQILSGGEKVVIFSTFKDTCYALAERLQRYNPVICNGDTPDVEISRNIEQFQVNPSVKVMIATHQKMGTGITLTAASNAIFIDMPWTDGNFAQACDRIYRIGTSKPVTIYCLINVGTIDERVLEIVQDKAAISGYVLDGTITESGVDSLRKYIYELKDIS